MPTPAARPPLSPRTWPVWLGIGIGWLLARLPWSLQRMIGGLLGALLYRLMPARRRVAARNISVCLPALDEAAQTQLLRDNFRDLGIGLFEFMRAWWGDVRPMQATVRLEGLDEIKALHASGRGLLLVSGHFMNLELCGRLLCDHLPVAGMYRPHDTAAMEWAVLRGRLRYAKAMFTRDELRAAVRHLKQGGVLWYAPDQDMRGKDSVFAPFFGIPASSITATHQLARLTGAAVVPFFHRREGDRYVIRLAAPLAPFPTPDAVADTAQVNAAIEAMVRAAPAQYLWLHKRFKRRPPGALRIYD